VTKLNKDIAGFQMLSMLSQIDGEFKPEEGKVIVDYITQNFPIGGNFDAALEELCVLKDEDYLSHFEKIANDFLEESTEKERLEFLRFAMKLINADEKVAKEEDTMVSRLFQWWGI
jgi:uncharacterized tellurite resistance protein B-like protein